MTRWQGPGLRALYGQGSSRTSWFGLRLRANISATQCRNGLMGGPVAALLGSKKLQMCCGQV